MVNSMVDSMVDSMVNSMVNSMEDSMGMPNHRSGISSEIKKGKIDNIINFMYSFTSIGQY